MNFDEKARKIARFFLPRKPAYLSSRDCEKFVNVSEIISEALKEAYDNGRRETLEDLAQLRHENPRTFHISRRDDTVIKLRFF